ncbi:cell division protein [Escherichia coli]|uniref:Cell division protein FtsN n=1 Tax=Escherichia coli TaxID=562 RepID=A0A376RRU9_ECOLX|nr:cell division protein [Escherichia coli]
MVAIAAAVLVTFIGGLYFITHHKKEESETLQSQKVTGNGLPPKPEERWRYIKELESRQPGVRAPTEPSAGGEVKTPEQLTPEQRQLLEQMQADMRQQPTQLVEVPWNEQTPEQRQQTLQRQRQAQQLAEQQRLAQQSRTTEQSWQQQTRTSQAAPVQAQPRQSKPALLSSRTRICCKPLRTRPRSRSRSKLRRLLVPLTRQNRRRRKKTNAAGWCSAVRSEARNRQRRYVLSWRSKDLTRKSPPTMAGIVWSLAR